MGFVETYQMIVKETLGAVALRESGKIERAGELVASSLEQGGLLYVFGCGHSHMIEEELFYRAGGLAAVYPMFDTATMLHEGASKSSAIEKRSGYAELLMSRYPMGSSDCLLVVSTSGINPFAIEVAQLAHARGASVVGISSYEYLSHESRHPDGFHLPDVCDVCVDNHVASGDASVAISPDGIKAGPTSSIASLFIANLISLSACEQLCMRGVSPEVFLSGNCEGTSQHNALLVKKYSQRVRSL